MIKEEEGHWYHGSPYELKVLRKGSTITKMRDLARIFSHKPEIVSIDNNGHILHTGVQPGYLYQITETVTSEDVVPHPRSTMQSGYEWIINRPLKVSLLCVTIPCPDERLSEEDIEVLSASQTKSQNTRDAKRR